jgi:tellurium resistance protein TerD
MAISLKKGESGVILTKDKMSKVTVGLGWKANEYDGGFKYDLDASAFLLLGNNRVSGDSDIVFYGQPNHKPSSGSVYSLADDQEGGSGDDDNEQIKVDLSKIPAHYAKIVFTVTIHEAEERKQNFGQVSKAYIRIVDDSNGNELIHYDLDEDFSAETAVLIGEMYRNGAEWKFHAVGEGFKGGLAALCKNFGVDVK